MLSLRMLLLLWLSPALLWAADPELTPDTEWLRIGLYKGRRMGYESLVSDPTFFLAPDGRENPKAELIATVQAFRAPVTEAHRQAEAVVKTTNPSQEQIDRVNRAHALCRYPARREYLRRHYPELDKSFPEIQCGRMEQFLGRVKPSKVSVVFSSYFLGNPASAFGHILLRLHNANFVNSSSELLDTAVGFAANPTTNNPVLYALYGLVGLFPGTFTAQAYYRSVREYNDQESRDLWSYPLNLKPEELTMLSYLIWEMGSTFVDYYYFTVNCGTLMLDMLDAAAPRLHLRDRIPFYVLPIDVIQAIHAEPGLAGPRQYRPSLRRQFESRYQSLSDAEKAIFSSLVSQGDPKLAAGLPPDARVRVLDAWSDFIEYRSAKKLLSGDPEASELKQRALLARAELQVASPTLNDVPVDEAPDLSHPVRRVSLGFGYGDRVGALTQLRYRFALHGFTDDTLGLPKNTEITFMELTGSLYQKPTTKFYLDDITLFRVASFNPWKDYERRGSFRVGLNLSNSQDPDFENPLFGTEFAFGGGYGIAVPLFTSKIVLFGLAQGKVAVSGAYRRSWVRAAIGPQLGVIVNFSSSTKLLAEGTFHYRPWADTETFSQAHAEFQFALSPQWSPYMAVTSNSLMTKVHGGIRFFH